MRLVTLIAAAALLLAGCSDGGSQAVEASTATREPAQTSSAAAMPSPDQGTAVIDELCSQYCAMLNAATDTDCPEPATNVSLCVDYLTKLIMAVSDIDAEVSGLPYAARDHASLLQSTRAALDESEDFASRKCYLVTGTPADGDISCGLQTLTLRITAETVGVNLQGASTRA